MTSTGDSADTDSATEAVVTDPEILGGESVLKGTRMPVYMVADMRKSGMSMGDILHHYPILTSRLVELAELYAEAKPRGSSPQLPYKRDRPPLHSEIVPKRKPGL